MIFFILFHSRIIQQKLLNLLLIFIARFFKLIIFYFLNHVWIICKNKIIIINTIVSFFVLFFLNYSTKTSRFIINIASRAGDVTDADAKKETRRMNNRYRKYREMSALHESCSSSLESPSFKTASLCMYDACIEDFHRVPRNCRMRFAFRVLWSAVTLSTEVRTLTTFPIVCGIQPLPLQPPLPLPTLRRGRRI